MEVGAIKILRKLKLVKVGNRENGILPKWKLDIQLDQSGFGESKKPLNNNPTSLFLISKNFLIF